MHELVGWPSALAAVGPDEAAAAIAGCAEGMAVGIAGPAEMAAAIQQAGGAAEVLTPEGVRERIAATIEP